MELIEGNVQVAWVELGEGWSGEYNEDDPEDIELLRFDTFVRGPLIEALRLEGEMVDDEWAWVHNGSHCTRFPVATSPELQLAALRYIMERVGPALEAGDSPSRLLDEMSWIEPGWVEPKLEQTTEQI
jgi:hypothetical protein